MKIGIFKPGKKICFQSNEEDHSAISIEITRIIQILAQYGHNVFILSGTDYIKDSIKNVKRWIPLNKDFPMLDKTLIYNGPGLDADLVSATFDISRQVDLIVTDMGILPDQATLKLFNTIYSQSQRWQTYGAIQEHECYQYVPMSYIKKTHIYFGGTERGRTKDFFEYVHRPDVKWFGKSQTLGIKNYIPYNQHIEEMKRAKYSIVIGDEIYNLNGFITPRYYECIRYKVIPFVDMKYDPDEIMIKMDDYRRVGSYLEMTEKIKELDSDIYKYMAILHKQEEEMKAKIDGKNIEKLLTGTNVQLDIIKV